MMGGYWSWDRAAGCFGRMMFISSDASSVLYQSECHVLSAISVQHLSAVFYRGFECA